MCMCMYVCIAIFAYMGMLMHSMALVLFYTCSYIYCVVTWECCDVECVWYAVSLFYNFSCVAMSGPQLDLHTQQEAHTQPARRYAS